VGRHYILCRLYRAAGLSPRACSAHRARGRHKILRSGVTVPFDRKRYPVDWDQISRAIRDRAGARCECSGECGYKAGHQAGGIDAGRCLSCQGEPNPVTRRTVILTVAHLNHTPADCRPENLRAMCQRCHLNYDRAHHIANARRRRRAARASGELFGGEC
jgi:hypothetical protein